MTKMFSLVLAGTLLATVCNLVAAGSSGGGTTVTTYDAGFEMRKMPRDWICCTPLKSLNTFAESMKVLMDFADGENDQKQKLTLSPAAILIAFKVGSGELCRYIEEESTGTVVSSPVVQMMKATIFDYFAKKVESKSVGDVQTTYKLLKRAIGVEGGEPQKRAWFKMMIVEKTPEGDLYVGAPFRPF